MMAQNCVMARIRSLVLLDSDEGSLAEAKEHLESMAEQIPSPIKIYTFATGTADWDRITSIFFQIRSIIGIPDILVLEGVYRDLRKSFLAYDAADLDACLSITERRSSFCMRNFLVSGTKKKKILINLCVVTRYYNGEQVASKQMKEQSMLSFGHARRSGMVWNLDVHDLLQQQVSTRVVRTCADSHNGWIWDER